MRRFFAVLFVMFASSAAAQDTPSPQHQWLKRFEGSWKVTYRTVAGDDQPATEHGARMAARMMGPYWLVWDMEGSIAGTPFRALQQVGFDEKRGKFVGSWIDTSVNHLWQYEGELDTAANKLVLGAQGPNFMDDGKQGEFRDIYQFKSADRIAAMSQVKDAEGNWVTFMTGDMQRAARPVPPGRLRMAPFLMFTGQAEAAMNFYTKVVPQSRVEAVTKYGAGENGREGTVKLGVFFVAGQRVLCTDSPTQPDFTFTPSSSFFIDCESAKQLEKLFAELSKDGEVMMPLDNYGFSRKFGWVADRFGVSWQLNLPQ